MAQRAFYFFIMTGLVALALAVGGLISNAHAQAISAQGIGTGGDKVRAIVPQAGNLFDSYEVNVKLLEGIVACAEQGLFVADADNVDAGCRGANAPEVVFVPDTSEPQYASHVRVQWDGNDQTVDMFFIGEEEAPELKQHPSSGTLAGAAGGYETVE